MSQDAKSYQIWGHLNKEQRLKGEFSASPHFPAIYGTKKPTLPRAKTYQYPSQIVYDVIILKRQLLKQLILISLQKWSIFNFNQKNKMKLWKLATANQISNCVIIHTKSKQLIISQKALAPLNKIQVTLDRLLKT